MTYEFTEGATEECKWQIETDYWVTFDADVPPCRHVAGERPYPGSATPPNQRLLPAVVVVHNQGGYDITQLCLGCLIAAARSAGLADHR